MVADKDSVWDLIGNEESFKDGMCIEMTRVLNLEKEQLKEDAALLDRIMVFEPDGSLQVKFQSTQDV